MDLPGTEPPLLVSSAIYVLRLSVLAAIRTRNEPSVDADEASSGPALPTTHHSVNCATTTETDEEELDWPLLMLDSGATCHIVNDFSLLHHAVRVQPVNISGVGGTTLRTEYQGLLGIYGPAFFVPTSKHNILSLSTLYDNGATVTFSRSPLTSGVQGVVTHPSYDTLVFERSGSLFFAEFPQEWHNPDGAMDLYPLHSAYPAVSVYGSSIPANYTDQELRRAELAGRLHRSLHHPCDKYLSTLLDNGSLGHTSITAKDLRNHRAITGPCAGCLLGKMKQPSTPDFSSTTAGVGEMLVMDLFYFYGNSGRKEPYLLSIESRTGYISVAKMTSKTTDLLEHVIAKILSFFSSHGHTIKIIRTDREANFLSCLDYLASKGVTMQRTGTARHAKQAERAIQTVKAHCRATKSSLGYTLPLSLYQYLVFDVVGALNDTVNSNCSPSTPSILITGKRASMTNHYSVSFGMIGTVKLPPNQHRDDLPRAALAMCIGRDRGSQRSLRVLVLSTRHVIHVTTFTPLPLTRDIIAAMDNISSMDIESNEDLLQDDPVLTVEDPTAARLTDLAEHHDFPDEDLDEHLEPKSSQDEEAIYEPLLTALPPTSLPSSNPFATVELESTPAEPDVTLSSSLDPSSSDDHDVESTSSPTISSPLEDLVSPLTHPRRRGPPTVIPTDRVTRSASQATVSSPSPFDALLPSSFDDNKVYNLSITEASVAHGPQVVENAIKDELRSLITETKALEPCFTKEKQLPMHLILVHKYDTNSVFVKTKARLVIGGNLQHRDEDIDTSSFCVRVQSILLLLGLAHLEKLQVHAVDIKTAYLHATVKSKVFGRMPKKMIPYLLELYPDMKTYLNRDGTMSFKVLKAVYGLAEASRLWFLHLTQLLSKLGYKSSEFDKGVLYKFMPEGSVYVLLHVDDMLVLTCDNKYWVEMKTYFTANLRGITAQEGPTISFVALRITCTKDCIVVDRRGYIEKLLAKRSTDSTPTTASSYPLHLNAMTSMTSSSVSLPAHALTSPIMELRYLDDVRPDIKFATSFLTMSMSSPTVSLKKHMDGLLSYLEKTKDCSIRIAPSDDRLHAYVDASYAIHTGSRSHYGIAVTFGSQGYAFHAKSGAIKVVCRSSTEAELHAANEASSDVLHAIDLLTELRHPQPAVPFYEDNQAVIQMMNGNDFNFQTKSKHVRVRYDFLKEQVRCGKICFKYLPTALQLADVMTKPLVGEKFLYFRDCLLGRVLHPSYDAQPPRPQGVC